MEDHRTFFRAILGEPERSYPDKEYVMYNCPFKDHKDHNPSFRVHKTGYYCYGCHKHGNYFQFLKDYNHWTNRQVKEYLKNLKKIKCQQDAPKAKYPRVKVQLRNERNNQKGRNIETPTHS